MKTEFHKNYRHIYFIGIGGISMSALSEILLSKGFYVFGSDVKESSVTKHLIELGIQVNIGQRKENITGDINLVVYTAAVTKDNPEIIAAKEKNIPTMDRAELLGLIMNDYKYSVAVSGTHGKTTTTSMISEILLYANTDPTITVGGILPAIKSNMKVGASEYFVAEACEYFDSFLRFNPYIAVILNIEADHLDYFKDLNTIRHSFHSFAKRVPENGVLVINAEIDNVSELTEGLSCIVETFAINDTIADWKAENIIHEEDGTSSFMLTHLGKQLNHIHIPVPGDHNISNALAACCACHALNISTDTIASSLKNFLSADRRFQNKGEKNGIIVIDDYAHHPTEIKATLRAAKNLKHKKMWCVFQPHTYSRTYTLFNEFSESFYDADNIIIADIFPAREKDTGIVSAKELADTINQKGKNALHFSTFQEIEDYLSKNCQSGDFLLTIGAGNVNEIGEHFLNR